MMPLRRGRPHHHVRPARIVKPTRNLPTKKREDPEKIVTELSSRAQPRQIGTNSSAID
jgi:hypothetical protein